MLPPKNSCQHLKDAYNCRKKSDRCVARICIIVKDKLLWEQIKSPHSDLKPPSKRATVGAVAQPKKSPAEADNMQDKEGADMPPENQTTTAPDDRMYLAIQWIMEATEEQIEKAYRILFDD